MHQKIIYTQNDYSDTGNDQKNSTDKTGFSVNEGDFVSTIPVIDMHDFQSDRKKFVDGLRNAFSNVGFVGIQNTCIQEEMLKDVYSTAKIFFNLETSQKKEITSLTNSGERGYVGTSESPIGKDIAFKDKKEFLHFGQELDTKKQQELNYPLNLWPSQVDIKKPVMTLYDTFSQLVPPLSIGIEEAICAPTSYIQSMLLEGDHLFRIIKYPNTLQIKEEGAAPHTDSNFFTILPPATCSGLEVLKENRWIPIVVPSHAVIVNVGSMLEHMTNGFFHAAVHRVVKHEGVDDRYAIAYFVHSREKDPMTPIPSCIKLTGGVQKYPSATRQELLDQRLIAMDRASSNKVKKYASSGLLQRWQNYLSPTDKRNEIKKELEKVDEVIKKTI